MSFFQDTTLLSATRPSRSAGAGGSRGQQSYSLRYKNSLSALSGLVRDPVSTLSDLRQGWDGLTKEERAEKVQLQARKQVLYLQLRGATSFDEWKNAAIELDDLEDNNSWKKEIDSQDYNPEEVRIRLEQLDAARISRDVRRMLFLIRTTLTRNLGNMGNLRLYSRSFIGTKDLIEQYINSALENLDVLLEMSDHGSIDGITSKMMLDQVLAARQAFGRSALLVSGGANFGMNHIGVFKTLFEQKLMPRIISGASAGSIVCAVFCTHTDEEIPEILNTFCEGNLAVYEEPGSEGSILNKITRLLKYGSLFDVSLLIGVVKDFIGDLTFQEAYNRTRRILNICVSSASLYELPRLLNYVTAPNVLIWSAVAASCSVPLIFTAASILAKDPVTGEHVPWNSSPEKYIDGSVDGDLPMTRLAEMFNVNHFIVSQVNPHVVPFIAKEEEAELSKDPSTSDVEGHFSAPSWLHMLTGLAKSEAIYRMHTLIDFGVLPTTLTKTVSVLSQKYSGDITILPEISYGDFPTMVSNPSVDFLQKCLLRGERATWPKISRIRNHLAIELALDAAVQQLRTRVVFSSSQADLRLGVHPKAHSEGRSRRNLGQAGRHKIHRRTSQSSEMDASAAHVIKHGRPRISIDSTHSKARSVHLPWNQGTISHVPAPAPAPAAEVSPPQLSDVLSSGAETSNIYTSESHADQSSSESPLSPASPVEPEWDGHSGRYFPSYSVPATPAAHRRLGSYLALSGAKATGQPWATNKSNQVHASSSHEPSPQETRYKRLFHPSRSSSRRQQGHSVSPPPSVHPGSDAEAPPTKSVKRFNALGLEIDLSGARGVAMRKKPGQ